MQILQKSYRIMLRASFSFFTHFVMPLLTPALQARIPFILLMRLLFPTLGKPEG